ncbi:hypothetical protein ACQ4PT_032212 [Festuca glaucescens]
MDGAALEETGKGGGAPPAGVTLEELRKKMADFARERDWEQYHSPRNLLLALISLWNFVNDMLHLVGEVGELSEIFQWKGEVPKGLPAGWEERETEHLGEELADVLLYLVRLSDMCGVDLGKAALRKIELNARKYPAGQASGSSRKRTRCSDDSVRTSEDCGSVVPAAGESKEEQ